MISLFRKKSCHNCIEASRCKTRQNVANEIFKLDVGESQYSKMRSSIYRSMAADCPVTDSCKTHQNYTHFSLE